MLMLGKKNRNAGERKELQKYKGKCAWNLLLQHNKCPKMVENPAPRRCSVPQNRFWRAPTRPKRKKHMSGCLGDASRLCWRRPLGSPKSLQTCSRRTSKRQLNSKRLLEPFRSVAGSYFEGVLEAVQNKTKNRKRKPAKMKSKKLTNVALTTRRQRRKLNKNLLLLSNRNPNKRLM